MKTLISFSNPLNALAMLSIASGDITPSDCAFCFFTYPDQSNSVEIVDLFRFTLGFQSEEGPTIFIENVPSDSGLPALAEKTFLNRACDIAVAHGLTIIYSDLDENNGFDDLAVKPVFDAEVATANALLKAKGKVTLDIHAPLLNEEGVDIESVATLFLADKYVESEGLSPEDALVKAEAFIARLQAEGAQ